MRVVHLSTNDIHGGAARAAYRLHQGLRRLGHDSSMIVANRETSDPEVMKFDAPANLAGLLSRRIRQRWSRDSFSRYLSTRPAGYDKFSDDRRCLYGADLLPGLPPYDVINLHWIADFVDVGSFVSAVPRQAPVFWKLDDMNALTGGCHFDHDCGKHATGCGACPQLGSSKPDDLSHQIWNRKKAAYGRLSPEDLHIIALNTWMAKKVAHSPLLGKFKVTVIPNGLDTDTFAPRGADAARDILGVPRDARVIFFAAEWIHNKRKGFALLAEALAGLRGVEKLFLLSVGRGTSQIASDIPHLHLGYIDNERLLSVAYSAADLYVIASVHDNQPNTVLEAMACGIPVVGFDVGGVSEMVRPGITGALTTVGDVAGLRAAMVDLLQCAGKRATMSAHCRRIVMDEYRLETQSRRYAELYDAALRERAPSALDSQGRKTSL